MRRALLAHYRTHHRDLPWRRTRDPWAIWVSEIMLQQTQVDTVERRYQAFLDEFPTIEALAHVPVEQVCEAWAGLGYYRRAKNLHAAARVVAFEHGGEIPTRADELVRLPGIGRYTAGAIASLAFDQPAPVVDGNVTRVLTRVLALRALPSSGRAQRLLWEWAGRLARGRTPGDVNQALMELGATLCTPRAPSCPSCPWQRWCKAAGEGSPERYPRASATIRRQLLSMAFAWVKTRRGVWLERRPIEGLWAGLWELPSASGRLARRRLAERLAVELRGPVVRVSHTLSHRDVRASIYIPLRPPRLRSRAAVQCVADPLAAPLSALARKAIDAMVCDCRSE